MNTNFTIYNATGEILRTGACPDTEVNNQIALDEFVILEKSNVATDSVDVLTHQIIPGGRVIPPPPPPPPVTYSSARKAMYPSIQEQMDMLWHSMDSGLTPKSQPFYDIINAIKTVNPKPDQIDTIILP